MLSMLCVIRDRKTETRSTFHYESRMCGACELDSILHFSSSSFSWKAFSGFNDTESFRLVLLNWAWARQRHWWCRAGGVTVMQMHPHINSETNTSMKNINKRIKSGQSLRSSPSLCLACRGAAWQLKGTKCRDQRIMTGCYNATPNTHNTN